MRNVKRLVGSTVALGALAMTIACSSSSTAAVDDDAGKGDSGKTTSGPPECTSSKKNAYDTYGAAGFVAVNQAIFANVTAELNKNSTKNLGKSFTLIGTGKPAATQDDLPTFEGTLAAFLVSAYGGPSSIKYTDGKTYSGDVDMTSAHTGLNITADQFNYFVTEIVVPALTSSGVKSEDVSSCFAPVITSSSFMASIVGH